MQGAAVASMLRNSRSTRKRRVTLDEVEKLLNEPVTSLFLDMDEVESVIRDTEHHKVFGLAKRTRAKLAREIQIEGMLEKVREKMARSGAYMRLLGTVVFFVIYVVFLLMQRNILASFKIEISAINLLLGNLSPLGSGGYTNSGSQATGSLSNNDDLYSW
eukprot:362434-Hanusia_phi.AAC.1